MSQSIYCESDRPCSGELAKRRESLNCRRSDQADLAPAEGSGRGKKEQASGTTKLEEAEGGRFRGLPHTARRGRCAAPPLPNGQSYHNPPLGPLRLEFTNAVRVFRCGGVSHLVRKPLIANLRGCAPPL